MPGRLDHGTDTPERPPPHERALSRIATLVAEGAEPEQLFEAVAIEVGRALELPIVTLGRYEPDRTLTILAAPHLPDIRAGARFRLDALAIAGRVFDTGRPARVELAFGRLDRFQRR